MRAFTVFGLNDLRNVRRDSLLVMMLLMPWIIVIFARLVTPRLTEWLASNYGFDLTPYYILIISFFFILQIPFMFGLIAGFLVLDERDDNVLLALQVTPVSITKYAVYRISIAIFLSVLYILLTIPLSGLDVFSLAEWIKLIPSAILSGLFATILAMILSIFASNKVEGLAITKALGGVFMLIPLVSYFINSKLQLLIGILPSYWPIKTYWAFKTGGNGWVYFIIGLIYLFVVLSYLLHLFKERIYRV